VQEKKLKDFLFERRWIYRRLMGVCIPAYADKRQFGLMEHKITTGEKSDGSEWINTQARITAKGSSGLLKFWSRPKRVIQAPGFSRNIVRTKDPPSGAPAGR
jgi:phage antirepressor YoqD-like protein